MTRYYVTRDRDSLPVYLGQQNEGVTFAFAAYQGWTPKDAMNKWIRLASQGTIRDETGDRIDCHELILRITGYMSPGIPSPHGDFITPNGNAFTYGEFS